MALQLSIDPLGSGQLTATSLQNYTSVVPGNIISLILNLATSNYQRSSWPNQCGVPTT